MTLKIRLHEATSTNKAKKLDYDKEFFNQTYAMYSYRGFIITQEYERKYLGNKCWKFYKDSGNLRDDTESWKNLGDTHSLKDAKGLIDYLLDAVKPTEWSEKALVSDVWDYLHPSAPRSNYKANMQKVGLL